jgi:hypothetical protein
MIKSLVVTTTIAAALTLGSAASAAVFKYTEGGRTDIDDSVRVTADGTGDFDTGGSDPGFTLAPFGAGDEINLHGRIIGIDDAYSFTSSAPFSLEWIFEGYMIGGVLVDEDRSGFSGVPAPGPGDNSSDFSLVDLGTNTEVAFANFVTDINRTTGDPQAIFSGRFAAGTYELRIDGLGPEDAYYDIRISAIPLPAGAVLLMTGLAGFGWARRRKAA